MDRPANLRIRAAAADIAAHGFIDICVGGFGCFREEGCRGHELPDGNTRIEEHLPQSRLLHRVRGIGGQSFDGCYSFSRHARNRRDAGPDGAAVQMHGAGAAESHPTAKLCTRQAEGIAQDPEKRCLRVDVNGLLSPIEGKSYGHGVSFYFTVIGTDATWFSQASCSLPLLPPSLDSVYFRFSMGAAV